MACFQAQPQQAQVHNIYNVSPSSFSVGRQPAILFLNADMWVT